MSDLNVTIDVDVAPPLAIEVIVQTPDATDPITIEVLDVGLPGPKGDDASSIVSNFTAIYQIAKL